MGDGRDPTLLPGDFDALFRPLLVHGFSVVKHGRLGEPKKRRFYCTNAMNRLYWDSSKAVDVLLGNGERSIELSQVVKIVDGIGTDLLRIERCDALYARQGERALAKGISLDGAPVKRAISANPVVKPIKVTAPNSVFALGGAYAKP